MSDQTLILERLLAELPQEKAQEVIDFATYLHQQYAPQRKRGSAVAILESLDTFGSLQFEEGELEALLADIEDLRELDFADDD